MIGRAALAILALLFWTSSVMAHELRPAYLEIRELSAGQYDVLWKRPMRGDRVIGLSVRWPDGCRSQAAAEPQSVQGGMVERQLLTCGAAGLVGKEIMIDGLPAVSAEVLVRAEFADGQTQANILRPAAPSVVIVGAASSLDVARDYFLLGVEHILLGIDHLLFVLGLTLIVRGGMLLVKTITAFTVAHSITLAMATLGVVKVQQAPVEAVIALSILFLAAELARLHRGEHGLTARAPWIVAFCFGLLHGFGFAGALRDVGLPQTDIPLALLTFNLGVEAGQLVFVAAVLAVLWAGRGLVSFAPGWARQAPAYAIGSLAALWFFERVSAL